MMGRSSQDQGQLFYSFNLEEVVPEDHLVRTVARVLDLSWVRAELAPHYSHTGRPSVDPVLMIPDADCRLRVCSNVDAA
jgi:transposase